MSNVSLFLVSLFSVALVGSNQAFSFRGSQKLRSQHFETLTRHDEHLMFFRRHIIRAQNHITVCSPYVRTKAIETGLFLPLIKEATQRGVKIEIFAKQEEDYGRDSFKAHELLKQAGAQVFLKNIHAKHFIVDNDVITFGSFNWLSAVSDAKSEFYHYETTMVLYGNFAKNDIKQIRTDLIKLKK